MKVRLCLSFSLMFLLLSNTFASIGDVRMMAMNLQAQAPSIPLPSGISEKMFSGVKFSDRMLVSWVWVILMFGLGIVFLVLNLIGVIVRTVVSLFRHGTNARLGSGSMFLHQELLYILFGIGLGVQSGIISGVLALLQAVVGKLIQLAEVLPVESIAQQVVSMLKQTREFLSSLQKGMPAFLNLLPTKDHVETFIGVLTQATDTIESQGSQFEVMLEALRELKKKSDYARNINQSLLNSMNQFMQNNPITNIAVPSEVINYIDTEQPPVIVVPPEVKPDTIPLAPELTASVLSNQPSVPTTQQNIPTTTAQGSSIPSTG